MGERTLAITTCHIDQLLPTDGVLEEFKEHFLTNSILRELQAGGYIRRPLEVSILENSGIINLYQRLGFSTDGIRYVIHVGHHRWAAAKLAGLQEMKIEVVPAPLGVSFLIQEMVHRSLGSK